MKYVSVPMPVQDGFDGKFRGEWVNVRLPMSFMELPSDIEWIWDEAENNAYPIGSIQCQSESLMTRLGLNERDAVVMTSSSDPYVCTWDFTYASRRSLKAI
jgi:hypothetical protein